MSRHTISMSKKTIYLSASQVAACIGKNPYRNRMQVLLEMFKKESPSQYESFSNSLGVRSDKDIAVSVLSQSKDVIASLETCSKSTKTLEDVATNQTKVGKAVASLTMTEKERSIVNSHIRSSMQTSYGTHNEKDVLSKAIDLLGEDIVCDNTLHTKHMGNIMGYDWVLCGKLDGRTSPGNHVVEIKNRIRGLFRRILEYERIQVLCYMHLLDCSEAYLIEAHRGDVLLHTIHSDSVTWKDIEDGLVKFVTDLCAILDGDYTELQKLSE